MFAVIRTGGKQYRVAPNDVIEIERIAGESGDIIELGEVLLLGGDSGPKTGSPTIAGALVAAELVEQTRGDKIIVFKKKRRKGYRRTRGHRQDLTMLRITEILTDGKKPSQTKVARPEPKKTEAKKPEAKKPEAKKPEAKKPEAQKADAKKAAAKPAKKPAAKKPAPTKKAAPAAKKAAPAKKPAAKKPAAKPAAKKPAPKKK
ncbi:MAG: 50S ribosomal protein L21 [Methyloceanibacter sp.]